MKYMRNVIVFQRIFCFGLLRGFEEFTPTPHTRNKNFFSFLPSKHEQKLDTHIYGWRSVVLGSIVKKLTCTPFGVSEFLQTSV